MNNNFLNPIQKSVYINLRKIKQGQEAIEHLNENAWKSIYFRDELGELLSRKKVGQRITDDTDNGAIVFANNCVSADDYVIINVQLNHDRKLGTELRPHLHWLQTSAIHPNWLLEYRWVKNGQVLPSTWTPLTIDTAVFPYEYEEGSEETIMQISKCDAIAAPEGDDVSDILQFKLSRDTGNVSTLFTDVDQTGNALAVMFDIHVQVNEGGSRQEYEK